NKPDIVTSRRGYMLSFPNEKVATSFHRMNAWRLGRVQTQQYGKRAVVRLEQRRYRPSPIEDNVKIIRVLGGMDIVVEENKVMPKLEPEPSSLAKLPTVDSQPANAAAPAPEMPVVQTSPMAEPATPAAAATIAALQRKLGGEIPVDGDQLPPAAALQDAPSADGPAESAPMVAQASPASDSATAEPAPTGTPLFAETEEPEAAAASAAPFSSGSQPSDLNRFGLVMMVPTILGLGLLMLWNKKRQTVATATSRMEVMSKIALGPKQQVIQVKVGGRELLLGVTEHQVGLISDVTASMGASAAAAEQLLAGQGIPGITPPAAASASNWDAPSAPETAAAGTSPLGSDSKIDAFKARLNAALSREMGANDSGERGEQARAQQVDDLRRVLSGAAHDRKEPAWATTDVQA
ncbi:MAG: FliO/MopB family protein, partial [Nannocystaceae bacterium]